MSVPSPAVNVGEAHFSFKQHDKHIGIFAILSGEILSTSMQEQELIKACIRNDRRAQKKLYEHYYEKMLAVCRRYVSQEDAKEVLNDGFMQVFKKMGQFGAKGSFEGWIRKVMVNKALDHLRSRKAYQEHISVREEVPEISSDTMDALQVLEMEEIYQLIEQIPPMSRSVFNMHAVDGFTHKEIAAKLNISEGTSRWHLSEARASMQEKIMKKAEARS